MPICDFANEPWQSYVAKKKKAGRISVLFDIADFIQCVVYQYRNHENLITLVFTKMKFFNFPCLDDRKILWSLWVNGGK